MGHAERSNQSKLTVMVFEVYKGSVSRMCNTKIEIFIFDMLIRSFEHYSDIVCYFNIGRKNGSILHFCDFGCYFNIGHRNE